MKISMIEPVSSHGGMNYYDYGLMKGFSNNNCYVTLYTSCPLNFDISQYSNLNVKYFYEGIYSGKNKIKRFFKYFHGTVLALKDSKKNGTQAIHFQVFAISILEIIVICLIKIFHFPVVVTVHDIESFNKTNTKGFTKFFYCHVDKIIVHNKISYNVLCESVKLYKYAQNIINNTHIIHHGSYIGMLYDKMNKVAAKQSFGINQDCFTFLFFGQIKQVKGLDILLQSLAKVVKNNTNNKVKLIIAGKVWKDDFSIYQNIIDDNNLSDYIILEVKYIRDDDVVKYYSAADCIVLPYKKIFQSGVLLMAQSYKIPVLVSDLPGMMEIVQDGENGFVFHSDDYKDLADKMSKIIKLSDFEIKEIVEQGYKKLQTDYSWDIIAKQQLTVIAEMLRH